MEIGDYREVYYHKYCPYCEYFERKGHEEPCEECLLNPTNNHSHKPVNFKENESISDWPEDIK